MLNTLVFANSGAGTNDITGGVLQLTNNGTTNPTITFINNTTYQRVSAPIQLDTNVTVSQSGSTASNSILAGVVSGAGGLTKSGGGYVYLTQTNNSFGAPVTIGNGTLVPENIGVAGQNSSLGTNGTITLGGGGLTGTLRWGSGSVTNEATDKSFALAGSTGGGTIEVRGATSQLTLNGAIDTGTNTAIRNFTLTGQGGATVNGLISGNGGLRVNGSDNRTVILANGNNSFGGPVTIDGNTSGRSYRLQVASIGNAGLNSPLGTNNTINIGTTVGSFNFLVWSNTVAETTDKTINLAGTVGGALIANKGPALLKFTAPVTATGVGTKTFYADQDDANGVTEFAGEIPNSSGGTTALNKNGLGALILSAANTFTGGFTLKGGTLELRNAQSLATGNILTVPANATLFPRVKVAYAGAGSDLGNLTLGADATIDLGTDSTAEIRFGSATGWTADKNLSVANSSGGGRLYILDTNNVALSQIKSLENPTWPASLDANGLLTFTAPAPVNTAPTITSGGAFSVPENSTAVTTVTATDAEGNALTYSISGGSDADKFWIDSGTGILTFVSAPNFESPIDVGADNVYNLTVQVADGVLAATKDIAVTVTNVSDSPTDYKADWLAANGLPPGSIWNSDPNNVGYSLATAYAFGLSPSVNSGAPVALASSPAGSVKIVYLQREDISGVIYTVKSGTDLAAGLNGTVNPQVSANQPVPGKPGYTQYEASYSSGVGKGFLRVQAEVP
jgi:autotransporter-associated beta strand protein